MLDKQPSVITTTESTIEFTSIVQAYQQTNAVFPCSRHGSPLRHALPGLGGKPFDFVALDSIVSPGDVSTPGTPGFVATPSTQRQAFR